MNGSPRDVIVLGGGVAGIAAAVRLAQRGVKVTLIETRKRLGGRAGSFPNKDTAPGSYLDQSQHVLLGCCTNLMDLYERLGVSDRVTWLDRLHFFDKQGHHDVLSSAPLPAPLHLGPAMLRFGTLTWRDKLAIQRAMLRMLRIGVKGRAKFADRTFGQWLHEMNQPERAIERFWAVIVVSACNLPPGKVSAAVAMQVFQEGFLAHRRAYLMGVSKVPLVRLYDQAEPIVRAAGGQVMLGQSIERLRFAGGRITGVMIENERWLEADAYISALPFDRLAKIAPPPPEGVADDARFRWLDKLDVSPIIGIHLWLDRAVMEWSHMIFVDSPLEWVFRKSEVASGKSQVGSGQPQTANRKPQTEQYLHAVVSAADAWVDKSQDEIVAMAMSELAAYLPGGAGVPAIREAKLLRAKVVKEKRATFAAVPGSDAYRPATCGETANLMLAGDWTATGWPATMEGATRSGYAAAGALLNERMLVDDLPAARITRWLAR
ncbi:MAG: hydroxysqualene dehydroxylase HpnE [Phycisphaeraceae bacterium]